MSSVYNLNGNVLTLRSPGGEGSSKQRQSGSLQLFGLHAALDRPIHADKTSTMTVFMIAGNY